MRALAAYPPPHTPAPPLTPRSDTSGEFKCVRPGCGCKGADWRTRNALTVHRRTYPSISPCVEPGCACGGKDWGSAGQLDNHKRDYKIDAPCTLQDCELFGHDFGTRRKLSEHQWYHHPSSAAICKLPGCQCGNKNWITKGKLRTHHLSLAKS